MGNCGGANKNDKNDILGETSIALIGVGGQGKTTFCKALSELYKFQLPAEESDGTNRFILETTLENQGEQVNILSTSGEDIMERTKMGLFGQSDVFFVLISVSSENKQFIKDNLVDIYVYFDKLKQSQHNGKTYLVATKADLRKTDKSCVTEGEIREMFTEKLGKKKMGDFLYYEVSSLSPYDGIDALLKAAIKGRRLERPNQTVSK